MAPAVLQGVSSLVLIAGLATLYQCWRRKADRAGLWRYGVAAAWGLVAAGLVGWAASASPDIGLSVSVTLAMALALAMIAGHSLAIRQSGRKASERVRIDPDGLDLGPGYWGRFAVRLAASLLVVPMLALLLGLLWAAHGPGDEATRLIGMAILAVLAMAGGLVALLASDHPYRTAAVLSASTGAAAALVLLPLIRAV